MSFCDASAFVICAIKNYLLTYKIYLPIITLLNLYKPIQYTSYVALLLINRPTAVLGYYSPVLFGCIIMATFTVT